MLEDFNRRNKYETNEKKKFCDKGKQFTNILFHCQTFA